MQLVIGVHHSRIKLAGGIGKLVIYIQETDFFSRRKRSEIGIDLINTRKQSNIIITRGKIAVRIIAAPGAF